MEATPVRRIKLYTDLKYCSGTSPLLKSLNPIVLAHYDSGTIEEKIIKHHARFTHFELTPNIFEADWCILPSIWTAYVGNGTIYKAQEFAKIADKNNKLVLVWAGGDPEWIIPISNAIQVQEGLHSIISRKVAFAFERPGFVDDYVEKHFQGRWKPLSKGQQPLVGFCGMAEARFKSRVHFYIQNTINLANYRLGRNAFVPVLYGFPVDLRARALGLLKQSDSVQTDFIIRDVYRGGVSKSGPNLDEHATRLEFVNNILDTAYTVCVRGGGNFSKRFYETLACGRIPVLVDTDCVLPYQEFIDWDKRIVLVEYENLDQIVDKVLEFHNKLTPGEFEELQVANRELWRTMLSVRGYYQNFHRYLPIAKMKA